MERYTQIDIIRMKNGIMEFAWFPTKLQDGTRIWLKPYFAVYHGGTRDNGDVFLWSGAPDTFIPIIKRFRSSEDAIFDKLRA